MRFSFLLEWKNGNVHTSWVIEAEKQSYNYDTSFQKCQLSESASSFIFWWKDDTIYDYNNIFWLNCDFSKNPIGSPRGKYFPQKCHLWVKKYESSKIMVIFKGDTFEKKVSPSVTKCHLWPKKVKSSVILTILKGDTFFPVIIWTLL